MLSVCCNVCCAGDKCLDVGCGIGGPLREIALFSGTHVTGELWVVVWFMPSATSTREAQQPSFPRCTSSEWHKSLCICSCWLTGEMFGRGTRTSQVVPSLQGPEPFTAKHTAIGTDRTQHRTAQLRLLTFPACLLLPRLLVPTTRCQQQRIPDQPRSVPQQPHRQHHQRPVGICQGRLHEDALRGQQL